MSRHKHECEYECECECVPVNTDVSSVVKEFSALECAVQEIFRCICCRPSTKKLQEVLTSIILHELKKIEEIVAKRADPRGLKTLRTGPVFVAGGAQTLSLQAVNLTAETQYLQVSVRAIVNNRLEEIFSRTLEVAPLAANEVTGISTYLNGQEIKSFEVIVKNVPYGVSLSSGQIDTDGRLLPCSVYRSADFIPVDNDFVCICP